MVRNRIPRICIYFSSTDPNSELCSLPQNGSEQNYWNLLLYIFVPRNGIPSYFLFRGRVRNGIPRFSFPRNNRNSIGNNHLFRLFCLPRNYFLSEIPNPNALSTAKIKCTSLVSSSLYNLFLKLWPCSQLWKQYIKAEREQHKMEYNYLHNCEDYKVSALKSRDFVPLWPLF